MNIFPKNPKPKTQNKNYNQSIIKKLFKNLRHAVVYISLMLLVVVGACLTVKIISQTADAENLGSVEIWWPAEGGNLSGNQPIKAMLQNRGVESYNMFWQVDGGGQNYMGNNYSDYPHKENSIDFSGWNWKGAGPYQIKVSAYDFSGQLLGFKNVNIYVGQKPVAAPIQALLVPTPTPIPPAQTQAKFFINPNSSAKQQYNAWASNRPSEAAQLLKIANQPAAIWLGDWNGNVKADVQNIIKQSQDQNATAVFVLYNLPRRDCGGYSSGGAASPENYKKWINQISQGIGGAQAWVILEPDGLTLTDCLSKDELSSRYDLYQTAVKTFKNLGNTKVYIDAGHSAWLTPEEDASRLQKAGVGAADGFALNTSNFRPTAELEEYGQKIAKKIDGKHYIIDTSRNGNGASGQAWCNPGGRALGQIPTTQTGQAGVDAFLWLKAPGESDGNCNGGPSAGAFWADYALELIRNSK